MTLRNRLFIYFVILSVIPVLIIGGISYFLSFRNISDNAVSVNLSVTDRVASDIEKMLEDSFNAANSLEDSIIYQEAMRKRNVRIEDIYSSELKVSLNMYVEGKYRPDLFGLYLIGADGTDYKSSFCTFLNEDLRQTDLYRRALGCEEMTFLGSSMGSRVVSSLEYPMLAFGKAYRDKATGQTNGAIILEIEREKLEELLSFDIGSSGYLAIVDNNDAVIASVGDEQNYGTYYGLREHDAERRVIADDREAELYSLSPIVIRTSVRNTEFSLLCVVPSEEIFTDSQYIGMVIWLMCLILCVAALIIAWSVSGKVTRPIRKLVELMHQVESGDLTVSFVPKYNDEIGILFRRFNVMIEKVNMLMLSIEDEQKKLRASEMRALMNQINPHFLYNTLDSIVWMCRAGRTKEAAAMTEALSAFFRIGLSRGRDIISVEEELLHAKNYLQIQEIRGSDTFDYEITADESLYEYTTVKFVLQPLIENAIYHGIYKLHSKGHIAISVYEEDDTIVMGVTDTGAGMLPAAQGKLRRSIDEGQLGSANSYGLVNVDRRIKAFFGEKYGLRFFSQYGNGSTFEIVIPKVAADGAKEEQDV